MKIVLYTRRNVGLYCLSHLVALGHDVDVITDDKNVEWLANRYGCSRVIGMEDINRIGKFELFLCIHGNKIINKDILINGWCNYADFVNIHPCLYKYKGHNPIKRYIIGKDTDATVESHYMTDVVDEGEVIHSENFTTPICSNYADFYNVALPYYIKCLDETLNRFIG
jgi:methionyl-tRNA formyltransferase